MPFFKDIGLAGIADIVIVARAKLDAIGYLPCVESTHNYTLLNNALSYGFFICHKTNSLCFPENPSGKRHVVSRSQPRIIVARAKLDAIGYLPCIDKRC